MLKYTEPVLQRISSILGIPEFRVHTQLTRRVFAGPMNLETIKSQAKATEGELAWGWRVVSEPWIEPWFAVLEYDIMILEKDGRFHSPNLMQPGYFAPVAKFAPEYTPSDVLISTRAFEAHLNKVAPWTPVHVAREQGQAPYHYSTDDRFSSTQKCETKEQAIEFVQRKGMTATPLILMAQAGYQASEQERLRYSIYSEKPGLQSKRVCFQAETDISKFSTQGVTA